MGHNRPPVNRNPPAGQPEGLGKPGDTQRRPGLAEGHRTGPAAVVQPSVQAETKTQRSTPYGFFVVGLALLVLLVVFIVTMSIFRPVFTDATAVTTALSSLFTVIGTVVGAYFGIKLSSDTADK